MAYIDLPDGVLHYEVFGAGPTIVATHGFSETGHYWSSCNVAQAIAEAGFRFVALDMRGHGASHVAGGYDVETIADDLDRLADRLGVETFHLLGHATGSVVAVRYAMTRSARLRSLALTSAASATAMISPDPEENRRFFGRMSRFYATSSWDEILPRLRAKPWPFLHHLDRHDQRNELWGKIEAIFRANEPSVLSVFAASFYDDPDPQEAALAEIATPTLVVTAEHDELMNPPSAILLERIPGAVHADLRDVGHMAALEAPDVLIRELARFFAGVEAALRR